MAGASPVGKHVAFTEREMIGRQIGSYHMAMGMASLLSLGDLNVAPKVPGAAGLIGCAAQQICSPLPVPIVSLIPAEFFPSACQRPEIHLSLFGLNGFSAVHHPSVLLFRSDNTAPGAIPMIATGLYDVPRFRVLILIANVGSRVNAPLYRLPFKVI
jgi:hypothetical protein